ncbi:hypothetical protein [Streptomyces sp. NPDC058045]|uniref:hypothetical protein n=1 Tax=Streptomyces sp. NPDC058045 TaxID=3346311 RepID=UPI0036EA41E7
MTTMTTTENETKPTAYPLVDAEWGPDPLEGIPTELVERRGSMDADTAGGCG